MRVERQKSFVLEEKERREQAEEARREREQFLKRHEAVCPFAKARDAQFSRGFRLMFAQCLEGPYGRLR